MCDFLGLGKRGLVHPHNYWGGGGGNLPKKAKRDGWWLWLAGNPPQNFSYLPSASTLVCFRCSAAWVLKSTLIVFHSTHPYKLSTAAGTFTS